MDMRSKPRDGFTETGWGAQYFVKAAREHHNVATPAYPLGTIVEYHNDTLGGYGKCIYLRYTKGAETLAAGSPVGLLISTTITNYVVSGDQSAVALNGPTAIALSAMTTLYYGWFWCAGVCPDFCTAAGRRFADGVITTGGNVAVGKGVYFSADNTINLLTLTGSEQSVYTSMGVALATNSSTSLGVDELWLAPTWG